MGKSAHIVAIPFPAQGHVIPLMELSHCLADHGMKVTFVNTEFNHARVVAALEKNGYGGGGRCGVRLVSIPDGLAPEDDRNDIAKLCQAMYDAVPFHLEKLIKEVNDGGEDDAVTCLIADGSMGSAFLAAEKMGIEKVTFWPAPTGLLASIIFIPRLIDENIIDANGKTSVFLAFNFIVLFDWLFSSCKRGSIIPFTLVWEKKIIKAIIFYKTCFSRQFNFSFCPIFTSLSPPCVVKWSHTSLVFELWLFCTLGVLSNLLDK